jgi:peptide subunit release factor 1 (eRF1)
MNTITVGVITYTEGEVLEFINKAQQTEKAKEHASDNRNKVYDFFYELEWENGQASVDRNAVNELLESIDARKLQGNYTATVTIYATVSNYGAESEDDVYANIPDEIELSSYLGDIHIDNIEVHDVEEEG